MHVLSGYDEHRGSVLTTWVFPLRSCLAAKTHNDHRAFVAARGSVLTDLILFPFNLLL